ncbi:MAG: carbon monoxide dehydrogenase subunit G [Oscillochloris sp.]|nr:carbon monoxide dehydrogenase subunit G [Oscillochloris sp.]
MRIAGNYTFEATREEVWSALNDPEVLARTIPGCQRLDEVGENEYETTLKIGLQAVRGVYSGHVKIDNIVVPESYELHVAGKGSNGFLKGSGAIKLRIEGETTILDYGGEAQIGGTIASVGQRLIDGAAKTLINQSLKALATQIVDRRHPHLHASEPEPPPVVTAEPPIPSANEAPPPAPTIERRTIVVPADEQLSEADVARGMIEDLLHEQPWVPWVIIAFLLGFLLGRRR